MSIGSLGGVSSLVASPVAQRTSDTEKTQAATSEKSRADAAVEYAEQAGGIGETKEESESSDRDADGRRLWEMNEQQKAAAEEEVAEAAKAAKDPTGAAGRELDLIG